MQLGIVTLRDLITYRPAVREECLVMLLEFCLHKGEKFEKKYPRLQLLVRQSTHNDCPILTSPLP